MWCALLLSLSPLLLWSDEGAADSDPPSGDELGESLASDATTAAEAEDDDWKASVDQFLADYLPTVVVANPTDEETAMEIELPDFLVEAEVDDARVKRQLPERWEILSQEAKKRALAYQKLTQFETQILNRWILPWGFSPQDYVLMREENERIQREMAENSSILKTLEQVRPGILTRGPDE